MLYGHVLEWFYVIHNDFTVLELEERNEQNVIMWRFIKLVTAIVLDILMHKHGYVYHRRLRV
jgi:hypothetical protein